MPAKQEICNNIKTIHSNIKFVEADATNITRQCRASDLTGGDRLEEKPLEQKGKDDSHETCEDLRECHQAFLSPRDPKMLGMSEANQASSDALAADSGHIRWSD
jgi:hypothetical protein